MTLSKINCTIYWVYRELRTYINIIMIIDPYEPPLHSADPRALGAITEDEENVSDQQDREAADKEAKAKQNQLMDTDKSSGLTKADVDLLRGLSFCMSINLIYCGISDPRANIKQFKTTKMMCSDSSVVAKR